VVLVVLTAIVVVAGAAIVRSMSGAGTKGFALQGMQAVDAQLAAKAEESCWFKVKNRSSKSAEVRLWEAASSAGAKTERLGELLIVTGGLNQPVHDDRYYGCSLYEYTAGSPVVMTAIASPSPVRTDRLIPFGFTPDGHKQQR